MTAKHQTLDQKIAQGIAQHQFWIDDYQEVADPHLHCSWCEASILIDYSVFTYQDMSRRLAQFTSTHAKCTPQLAMKTKDMLLTPVEKAS